MSRQVIRDIVIPIISRIMQEEGYFQSFGHPVILDSPLEEFLEEAMRRHFAVIGANGCQHLKEQLEEAKKNDPYAFEFLIRRVLNGYVKLAVKMRDAKKIEKSEGPPDRFSEFRKRYPFPHQQEVPIE